MNDSDISSGDESNDMIRLHEEAEALLAMIAHPELLETQSLKDIRRIFQKSKYVEQDAGQVTHAWSWKVHDPDAATVAYFMTTDGKIVRLGIGSNGAYSLVEPIKDEKNPTTYELGDLVASITYIGGNVSEKCKEYLRMHANTDEVIATAEAKTPRSIRKTLKKILDPDAQE